MGPLSKRFVPLANVSIFLIITSGIIVSMASHDFSGPAVLSGPRAQSLAVKILLVAIMTSIHFYRVLILTPRVARLSSAGGHPEKVQKLQTLSLNLVKINFLLGIMALILTSMLYTFKA